MADTDQNGESTSLGQASRTVHAKPQPHGFRTFFQKFAQKTSVAMGSPWAFFAAALVIIGWAVVGPVFHYSDTWQLVINTGTTIVTFLMVFLIQNTQNRDAKAIQLKLDELIRSKRGARNTLVDLEDCTDEELAQIEAEFKRLRKRADRRPHNKQGQVEPAEKHPDSKGAPD
jgi:low affinity Fe/Cu permease